MSYKHKNPILCKAEAAIYSALAALTVSVTGYSVQLTGPSEIENLHILALSADLTVLVNSVTKYSVTVK
jgi:hypothetical protein